MADLTLTKTIIGVMVSFLIIVDTLPLLYIGYLTWAIFYCDIILFLLFGLIKQAERRK